MSWMRGSSSTGDAIELAKAALLYGQVLKPMKKVKIQPGSFIRSHLMRAEWKDWMVLC